MNAKKLLGHLNKDPHNFLHIDSRGKKFRIGRLQCAAVRNALEGGIVIFCDREPSHFKWDQKKEEWIHVHAQ